MKRKVVISGMQSGADLAGVDIALELGIPTGGFMPKGFLTENGPKPEYKKKYRAKEMPTANYVDRTKKNIATSNATIIFMFTESVGSRNTDKYCHTQVWGGFMQSYSRHVPYRPSLLITSPTTPIEIITNFLKKHNPRVVNIAGNRESKSPGIYALVKEMLEAPFETMAYDPTNIAIMIAATLVALGLGSFLWTICEIVTKNKYEGELTVAHNKLAAANRRYKEQVKLVESLTENAPRTTKPMLIDMSTIEQDTNKHKKIWYLQPITGDIAIRSTSIKACISVNGFSYFFTEENLQKFLNYMVETPTRDQFKAYSYLGWLRGEFEVLSKIMNEHGDLIPPVKYLEMERRVAEIKEEILMYKEEFLEDDYSPKKNFSNINFDHDALSMYSIDPYGENFYNDKISAENARIEQLTKLIPND